MNIIEYVNKNFSSKIAFCFVDNTSQIQDNFCKEIIKNQSDYTISNLVLKKYNVYQSSDENSILNYVSNLDYTHALVFSTGTEFINGGNFFNYLDALIKEDFFVAGHILDRGDAYYELHPQCYLINLNYYKKYNRPFIGTQELCSKHTQKIPQRSKENYHDNYTPLWVSHGIETKIYNHKCHGWNILQVAFENKLTVKVFNDDIRNNKKHLYPESKKDFLQNLNWIYFRETYAATELIHLENTENKSLDINKKFNQIVIPASGVLYTDLVDEGRIIFYDYNDNALNYWKDKLHRKPNIEYVFVKANLLSKNNLIDYISPDYDSLINLSNIFCYEGTSCLTPLYYRVHKENEIINLLKEKIPTSTINFSGRAASGFLENLRMTGTCQEFEIIDIKQLKKPTWHYNLDWN